MTKGRQDCKSETIDPAHRADVLESLAQAKCGDFASTAQVKAAFGRFQITDAQVAEVELTKCEVRKGQIATDDEMDGLWRRFGF